MSLNQQRTDLDRLRDYIAFAQADDATARRVIRTLMFPLPGWLQPADRLNFDAIAIRDEITAVLEAAVTGERRQVELQVVQQVWRDPKVAAGVLLSTSSVSTRDLILFRFLRFLERAGVDKVLRCPECARLFVKVTRKKYCSTRCQSRVWMREERAKYQEPKGVRRGKTTRTR